MTHRPNVRLIIIDPAGSYIGRTGVNENRDAELRSLLDPMAELAARRRVTIILVKHLNKGAGSKAVHRVSGSVGYVNAVRAAFIVDPDPDDPTRKLFLPPHFNIGPTPPGLAYTLRSLEEDEQRGVLANFPRLGEEEAAALGPQLFRAQWVGRVDISADEALSDKRLRRDPTKVNQCAVWLEGFLSRYAYPSNEIRAAAEREGFTFDNQKEAKAKLRRDGKLWNKKSNEPGGDWWSGLGRPETWTPRPGDPADRTADTATT